MILSEQNRGTHEDVPDGNPPPATRIVDTGQIFQEGETRVVIRHERREYVLLVTRQGKLLLNRRT